MTSLMRVGLVVPVPVAGCTGSCTCCTRSCTCYTGGAGCCSGGDGSTGGTTRGGGSGASCGAGDPPSAMIVYI